VNLLWGHGAQCLEPLLFNETDEANFVPVPGEDVLSEAVGEPETSSLVVRVAEQPGKAGGLDIPLQGVNLHTTLRSTSIINPGASGVREMNESITPESKSWFPIQAQLMCMRLRNGTICFPFVTVLTGIRIDGEPAGRGRQVNEQSHLLIEGAKTSPLKSTKGPLGFLGFATTHTTSKGAYSQQQQQQPDTERRVNGSTKIQFYSSIPRVVRPPRRKKYLGRPPADLNSPPIWSVGRGGVSPSGCLSWLTRPMNLATPATGSTVLSSISYTSLK